MDRRIRSGVTDAGIFLQHLLADTLRGPQALSLVDRMISEGVMSPQERAAYATPEGLTAAGKERIGKLLVGRFFRDPAQLDSTPLSLRNKLERMTAPLAKTSALQEWDLEPAVREAMDVLQEARAHRIANLDDLVRQQGMFGGQQRYSPQAMQMAKALLRENGSSIAAMAKQYARDAQDSQRPLLGEGAVTPQQAFAEAFGGAGR